MNDAAAEFVAAAVDGRFPPRCSSGERECRERDAKASVDGSKSICVDNCCNEKAMMQFFLYILKEADIQS